MDIYDVKEHYYFVMNDYIKYFSDRNGSSWYSITIKALVESAKYYEQKKIENENTPLHLNFKLLEKKEIQPEFALENQIGLILVLCQTYISNICKKVEYFYKDYEYFANKNAQRIPHKKYDLLKNHGEKVKNTNHTEVQVINALANYYKHHEEWDGSVNSQNKRTIDIIKDIGGNLELNFYWAQNLSKSMKFFGIDSVDGLNCLLEKVDNWKLELKKAIKELNIELPNEWWSLK